MSFGVLDMFHNARPVIEAPSYVVNPDVPPIFCVTLSEEPWKQEIALSHFSSFGLCPTFVYGIQGVTIGLKPTNPCDFSQDGRPLYVHMSQVGCALSHIMALSVAVASLASEFIICEDDVILCDGFTEAFQRFRNALPKNAEVAQLIHRGGEHKQTFPVNEFVKRIAYPFCTTCIWWSRKAAQRAIQLLKPIDRPYDVMLIQRVFPFLDHYVADPQLTQERSQAGQWPSAVGDAPKQGDANDV